MPGVLIAADPATVERIGSMPRAQAQAWDSHWETGKAVPIF
jgi:hypothetical protein